MRKWFAVLVVGACFCLPLAAQEKHADRNEPAKPAEEPKANFVNATAAASRSPWALPAQPRPTPFPAAAAASSGSTAPGRLAPRYEVAGGYSYINDEPGDPFNSFGQHGATGSFTFNPTSYLGLTVEGGGYNFQRNVSGSQIKGSMTSVLFGPRLNWRRFDRFVPFTEFLFGFANSGIEMTGSNQQSTFAMASGGGVDVVLTKSLAWRFAQIDYLMTNFSGPNVGSSGRQNNLRLGSGLVYRWGFPTVAPPVVNHPPVAACSVNPVSVYVGSSEAVAFHVNASDPDNDPLTYSYTATGGTIEGTGADARWNPSGLAPGTYTATAKVDDGKGGTASCSADLKVEPKPHHPPTVSCAADRSPIIAGERTGITATGNSPDGLPLTYSYSAASGQVTGDGAKATFDSTGLQPGSYPVKCMVNDGQPDGMAEAATNVEVKEPPQVKQLEAKLALHSIYFPTAQPTVAKPNGGLLASQAGTLDELARDFKEYLKYRPAAHLTLEGHADVRGAKDYNMKLSERRVERAKSYLIENGVSADKLETKAFGFEHNMTSEEVKKLLDADTELTPAERQKLIKNLLTVRLANNRRVDVTLSTTGEQSVRQFPFRAKDALTLLSRGGAEKTKTPAAKPKTAAPKKPANNP